MVVGCTIDLHKTTVTGQRCVGGAGEQLVVGFGDVLRRGVDCAEQTGLAGSFCQTVAANAVSVEYRLHGLSEAESPGILWSARRLQFQYLCSGWYSPNDGAGCARLVAANTACLFARLQVGECPHGHYRHTVLIDRYLSAQRKSVCPRGQYPDWQRCALRCNPGTGLLPRPSSRTVLRSKQRCLGGGRRRWRPRMRVHDRWPSDQFPSAELVDYL